KMDYNYKQQPMIFNNVRLETGFEWMGADVAATKTELFTVEIRNGKFESISPATNGSGGGIADAIDAKGLLMLPSFRDMHIHLDKTFYGGPWKARIRKNRTVKDMIALEEEMLPEMLK